MNPRKGFPTGKKPRAQGIRPEVEKAFIDLRSRDLRLAALSGQFRDQGQDLFLIDGLGDITIRRGTLAAGGEEFAHVSRNSGDDDDRDLIPGSSAFISRLIWIPGFSAMEISADFGGRADHAQDMISSQSLFSTKVPPNVFLNQSVQSTPHIARWLSPSRCFDGARGAEKLLCHLHSFLPQPHFSTPKH
jgi:hypothetical protein